MAFEQSRINEAAKEKFFPIVKSLLVKDEYTQDHIVRYLRDTFPDERTPSKGTINKWVKEIKEESKNPDSGQSPEPMDKDD